MKLFNNIVSALLCVLYIMIAFGCLEFLFTKVQGTNNAVIVFLLCVSCVMSSVYLGGSVVKTIQGKFKV